eukprot:Nk52_evm9s2011 gene=Nk52_evmTU9s2011
MPFLVGYVRTEQDANLCFRAACEGKLPLTTKRLTTELRKEVAPQQIYIYNEIESGISRWTDGRHWCNSYASGEFIVYKEAVIVSKGDQKVKEEKLNGLRKRIIADKANGSCLRLVCYTDATTFATTADLKRNHNWQLETLRVSPRVLENPIVGGFSDEDNDHSIDLGADFYRGAMSYPHTMRGRSFENTPYTGFTKRESYGAMPFSAFAHSQVNPLVYGSCYPFSTPYSGSMYVDSSMVGRLPYEQRANSTPLPSSLRVTGDTSFPRDSNTSPSSANKFNVPNSFSTAASEANLSIMFDSLPHSSEAASVTTGASGFESANGHSSGPIIANPNSPPTGCPVYNQASPELIPTSLSGMRRAIDMDDDSRKCLHRQSSVNRGITKTKTSHILNTLKRSQISNTGKHSVNNIGPMSSLISLDRNEDAVIDGRVPQFW